MARSFSNIMVKRAPLNFDQSLRKSNRFIWEKNVQGSYLGTLDTSSDSWIASAQCFKGAKQQKTRSSKNVSLPFQGLIQNGGCIGPQGVLTHYLNNL